MERQGARLVGVPRLGDHAVSGLIKWATAIPALDRAISTTFYRGTFGHEAVRRSFPHASPEELSRIFARIDQHGPANFRTLKDCVLGTKARHPTISATVSLLWGADDRFTPLAVARRLCKVLAGAELVTIEHAGHLPQWDKPREFVERLRHAMR